MAISFISCSSIESDAKKTAKKVNEINQINSHWNDQSNMYRSKESRELQIRENMDFANKMREKYKGNKEFDKLVEQEIEKLK